MGKQQRTWITCPDCNRAIGSHGIGTHRLSCKRNLVGEKVVSSTREYQIWKSMRKRCRNPRDKDYHKYGARGIGVCERWSSFQSFLADMGPAPEGKTLDRVDNDGDYGPSNCRWSTPMQQSRNTRINRWLTHEGRTMCATDWSAELGLGRGTLQCRIARGWTEDRIFSKKVGHGRYVRSRRTEG